MHGVPWQSCSLPLSCHTEGRLPKHHIYATQHLDDEWTTCLGNPLSCILEPNNHDFACLAHVSVFKYVCVICARTVTVRLHGQEKDVTTICTLVALDALVKPLKRGPLHPILSNSVSRGHDKTTLSNVSLACIATTPHEMASSRE